MIFEPITLTWAGKEYVIPADNVMKAIAKVEDIISLVEMARCYEKANLPLVKISQAYGAILRHAGARVADEEVYADLFAGADLKKKAIAAINTLQMMMIPPVHLRDSQGKAAAGATAPSSRKRSKPQ